MAPAGRRMSSPPFHASPLASPAVAGGPRYAAAAPTTTHRHSRACNSRRRTSGHKTARRPPTWLALRSTCRPGHRGPFGCRSVLQSGRQTDPPKRRVCTESIYRALFTGLLGRINGKLRTGRTKRKRQRRGVARTNEIPNIRPISHRPAEVRDRSVAGHWEGDLIIGRGQRSAIGSLVERTSRYLVLVHLPRGHKAPFVRDALIDHLQLIPHRLRKTLTWDRGRELFLHEQISIATGCDIYFCDPHAPWQRPSNENTNGLLRQYFPKSSDLTIHSTSDLQAVARRLNNRPRLVLGDRTPTEVMTQLLSTSNTT
jgi:IS30 family transposase